MSDTLRTLAYQLSTWAPIGFAPMAVGGLYAARYESDRTVAAAVWSLAGAAVAAAANLPLAQGLRAAGVTINQDSDVGFPTDVMLGGLVAGMCAYRLRPNWTGPVAITMLAGHAALRHYAGKTTVDVLGGIGLGAVIGMLGWRITARPLTSFIHSLRGQGA